MAYRKHEHSKPKAERSAVNLSTPIRLYTQNGSTASFAFPCWYQEVKPPIPARRHDRHLHDHQGWPSPNHPDHICQLWIPEKEQCIHGFKECQPHCRRYIDYSRVTPIHLLSEYEGYDAAVISWAGDHDGIEATAYIDPDDDWIVRVNIDCRDPKAIDEKQVYKFTVFVASDMVNGKYTRRNVVAPAELHVLPSAY